MDFKPETNLDQALAMAREDANQSALFYDAFLNCDLIVPVRREGADQGSWKEVAADERFFPLFLKAQDTRVLPVFDRLDRLQSWAEEKELDYLKIRCHLFLKTLPPEISIALNLGNAFYHFFNGEILEQLRQAAKPVMAQ